jgi:hypothetical protein
MEYLSLDWIEELKFLGVKVLKFFVGESFD